MDQEPYYNIFKEIHEHLTMYDGDNGDIYYGDEKYYDDGYDYYFENDGDDDGYDDDSDKGEGEGEGEDGYEDDAASTTGYSYVTNEKEVQHAYIS